ncbi:MAG: nucleotidyl transferase AbiEii/AbiGii toxin family protein [Desulfuromonadales bacterium]|nr:nucleotidyl transferase AbiEii/AbiGii toxin family protein [Desulfuromonadales bacterium]MBN2791511.1 nucleotidyl transferase AbiEii/AbiGii toxin family protein [Desulfuromonadales bacterium]
MFKRPHHQKIARVLYRLNAPLLKELQCYFGGGTAIALRYGEFRESVDIDFLVSDLNCYRELRQILNVNKGLEPILCSDGEPVPTLRDVRTDQYGIRTLLGIDDQDIKFEIVFEARVSLDLPKSVDQVCGVASLTAEDLFTEKLLSNSDRWRDDSVFSRDLIDLAMIDLPNKSKRQSIVKAENAYGLSIRSDLKKAIDRVEAQPEWLEYCRKSLAIQLPQAVLWKSIRQLRKLL